MSKTIFDLQIELLLLNIKRLFFWHLKYIFYINGKLKIWKILCVIFSFQSLSFFRFLDTELICPFDLINKQNSSSSVHREGGGMRWRKRKFYLRCKEGKRGLAGRGSTLKRPTIFLAILGLTLTLQTVCDMFKHKNLWCLIFFHLFTPFTPSPLYLYPPTLLFLMGGGGGWYVDV